jgi:hypothetical protein
MTRAIVVGAVLLAAGRAGADEPPPSEVREIRRIEIHRDGSDGDHTMRFAWSSELGDGKVVKNAPYSATAITEFEQTLGDGNRLRQKTSSQLARDREGRTRREVTLGAVGPLATGGPAALVFLQDPVAGTSYTLEPERKIARKLPRPEVKVIRRGVEGPSGEAGKGRVLATEDRDLDLFTLPAPPPLGGGGPGTMLPGPIGTLGVVIKDLPPAKKEDLGTQTIEGVRAEGTRTTTTLPAGAIGNERPIVVVGERWFAPELGVVVLSKHSDPRLGNTTYRLTNLRRSDPEAALFQVPEGYTVKEDAANRTFMLRRTKP